MRKFLKIHTYEEGDVVINVEMVIFFALTAGGDVYIKTSEKVFLVDDSSTYFELCEAVGVQP